MGHRVMVYHLPYEGDKPVLKQLDELTIKALCPPTPYNDRSTYPWLFAEMQTGEVLVGAYRYSETLNPGVEIQVIENAAQFCRYLEHGLDQHIGFYVMHRSRVKPFRVTNR